MTAIDGWAVLPHRPWHTYNPCRCFRLPRPAGILMAAAAVLSGATRCSPRGRGRKGKRLRLPEPGYGFIGKEADPEPSCLPVRFSVSFPRLERLYFEGLQPGVSSCVYATNSGAISLT